MKVYHSVRRGFTLLELMVVVAIIGVLLGILIPMVTHVRKAAQGAATSSQLASIATAIQQYYGDFKAYPGPLPNVQLGMRFYTAGTLTPSVPSISDPNNSAVPIQIQIATTVGTTTSYSSFPTDNSGGNEAQEITGTENLVLGLLGGLELGFNNTGAVTNFAYNPANIFPDGATPSAKGATSLDPNQPKRYQSYLQVKAGEISSPNTSVNFGQFTDSARRSGSDSVIPEFIDKYSDPMPILYLRANVGAPGVVSKGGRDGPTKATYQYDLTAVMGYTFSMIGTVTNNPNKDHHGLQGTVPMTPVNSNPMLDSIKDAWKAGGKGYNGLAYLKDPSTPAIQPGTASTPNTNGNASPRQKDAFILISAGQDGIYGTDDDVIYPGSLNP